MGGVLRYTTDSQYARTTAPPTPGQAERACKEASRWAAGVTVSEGGRRGRTSQGAVHHLLVASRSVHGVGRFHDKIQPGFHSPGGGVDWVTKRSPRGPPPSVRVIRTVLRGTPPLFPAKRSVLDVSDGFTPRNPKNRLIQRLGHLNSGC